LAYVLIGDIDEEGEGVSPTIKHLNFIHTLSNIIMVATENIRLFDESLQQESIKKEFELASKMQNMLIPENSILPKNKYIYVTAYYHPHFSVGGDYYDVLELGKNEIGFCIADVSGKGMSAAILMSNFQANLRALFTYEISLFALVEKLNVRVNHNAKGEKFITLFIGRYNFRTRELEYINAGHNPPVLYETKSKKIEYLTYGCVGMGMMDELPNVNKGLIHIKEHSKLLCYTDGLVELAQHKHIEYDTQEIEHCISNDSGIAENIQWLIEKQKINNNNTQFFDDISILGIEMF
jgi:sigma-B regulation protein RsbU (phosphoserine phosphatase)